MVGHVVVSSRRSNSSDLGIALDLAAIASRNLDVELTVGDLHMVVVHSPLVGYLRTLHLEARLVMALSIFPGSITLVEILLPYLDVSELPFVSNLLGGE
jgi:hypothetical protein